MAQFGENLKKAREKSGITQQELAEKIFVTRQTVSRWECGNRLPDLITTKKLAEILNVSIDELLSVEDEKTISEKLPVIEKKSTNIFVIIFYSLIVFSFGLLFVDTAFRVPGQLCFDSATILNASNFLVRIVIFVFGFFAALKNNLTPKFQGVITALFFIANCLPELNLIFKGMGLVKNLLVIFIMTVNFFGGIFSYFYFCKHKFLKLGSAAIIGAALFEIFRSGLGFVNIVLKALTYFSMSNTLNFVLEICICILFIYQTFLLCKKRKLCEKT